MYTLRQLKKGSFDKKRRCIMIKRTKHGRVSRGSEHGELPCKECLESTTGKEVVLVFYPKDIHAERHHTKCFLDENPHFKARYDIVMATMAITGVSEPSFQRSCNLCGFSTKGEDIIVFAASISGEVYKRKLFAHLSCFMGTNVVRHAPDVRIGRE